MANKRERAAQTVSMMNRTVSRLEDGERGIMEWIMADSCNDKKKITDAAKKCTFTTVNSFLTQGLR